LRNGLSVANIQAMATDKDVNDELLKNFPAKVKPIREECAKRVSQKYGFMPTSPY